MGSYSCPWQLEIGGDRDPLAAIQAGLCAFWGSHPHVPDDVRIRMAIAAGEVGADILEHAVGGRPGRIRMGIALVGDQVRVAFTDDYPPADIDLASVGMPDVMVERGRGLAMARAVLDQLAYFRDQAGNHWTLISQHFA